MRNLRNVILVLLILGSSAYAAYDGGTQSPFSFGAGARALALGGANLAIGDDFTSAYWNASRLARAERFSLGGFHTQLYDSDVAYQYLGLVYPTLDWGSFGLGVFRLGISGIEKRDINNFLIDEISDNRLGVILAYGRQISSYDMGISLNIEHHSLDTYKATSSPGLSLSLGRGWNIDRAHLKQISGVVNVRNILKTGMKLVEEEIDYPTEFEAALSVKLLPNPGWNHVLIFSTTVSKFAHVDPKPAIGLEYGFKDILFLRGGWRDEKLSVGVGISIRSITFDYALVDRNMGSLHTFNLTTAFGSTVSERKYSRTVRRETEFNSMMSNHLEEQNHRMVTEMVSHGRELYEAGDIGQAGEQFDRALFLARSNGIDTTEIKALAIEATEKLDEVRKLHQYRQLMDSAYVHLNSEDFLAARYFANQALVVQAGSTDAQKVLKQASHALQQASSREELIQTRLELADSLLSYGHLDDAYSAVRALEEYAPDNNVVHLLKKRIEFEKWRSKATIAYEQRDKRGALAMLDSALVLFPGHKACQEFQNRIRRELTPATPTEPTTKPTKPIVLSEEVLNKVSRSYKLAQELFKQGKLSEAIANWEEVEQLAPNHQSVREYLVNGYKFLGVELYSQNQLREAVEIWKKAAALDRTNAEIAEYIRRTENEIRKLRELSYEQ